MPIKDEGMGRHGSEVLHFKGGGAVDGYFVAQVQAVGAVDSGEHVQVDGQILNCQGWVASSIEATDMYRPASQSRHLIQF